MQPEVKCISQPYSQEIPNGIVPISEELITSRHSSEDIWALAMDCVSPECSIGRSNLSMLRWWLPL